METEAKTMMFEITLAKDYGEWKKGTVFATDDAQRAQWLMENGYDADRDPDADVFEFLDFGVDAAADTNELADARRAKRKNESSGKD